MKLLTAQKKPPLINTKTINQKKAPPVMAELFY